MFRGKQASETVKDWRSPGTRGRRDRWTADGGFPGLRKYFEQDGSGREENVSLSNLVNV